MHSATFAVWPTADAPVSVATWLRELRALVECLIAPPAFPDDAVRGTGQPVIVLPGFCSPNFATARLRTFLWRQGFSAFQGELTLNVGPTRASIAALEQQVSTLADLHGKPVSLVGLSLGGTIAREIAKRRCEHVSRVITLASPILLPVPTPLAPIANLAAALWDDDAATALSRLAEPPPVPLTAIVTERDGLVDWRYCIPAPAPNVEVVTIDSEHLTIGSNPEAQRVIATRLALI